MAAQSLRSRRHSRRADGVHSRRKTLLLRIHWTASQTMNPLSPRHQMLVRSACVFLAKLVSLRLFSHYALWLCGIVFFAFPSTARAQSLDRPTTKIYAE